MTETSLGKALSLLNQQNVEASALSADRLLVQGREFRAYARNSLPSVGAIPQGNLVYVLPRISPSLRKLAKERASLALISPQTSELWFGGKQLTLPTSKMGPKPASAKVNWARFGLLRSLARTSRPRTQAALAKELGITQAAVSQNLSNLSALVVKTRAGWAAKDFDMVAREFLDNYPGPGGVERYWYGLDKPSMQVQKVLAAKPTTILGGDFAGDNLAPWRIPTLGLFYAEADLGLGGLKMVEASKDQATLVEVIPADPTIKALSRKTGPLNLTDGLLVAFDLRRSNAVDAQDAIEYLLRALRKEWQKHDH